MSFISVLTFLYHVVSCQFDGWVLKLYSCQLVGPNFVALSLVIQLDSRSGKMCCRTDNSPCSKIVCHLGFFLVNVSKLVGGKLKIVNIS